MRELRISSWLSGTDTSGDKSLRYELRHAIPSSVKWPGVQVRLSSCTRARDGQIALLSVEMMCVQVKDALCARTGPAKGALPQARVDKVGRDSAHRTRVGRTP